MTTYVKKSETRDVVWRLTSYYSRGGAIPIDIDEATEGCIEPMSTIEITRCKDCIYKVVTDDGEYNPEDIVCSYWESDGLEEDDFCSYGVQKNERNKK